MRPDLIEKGKDLVYKSRYFTIWAPRQTGKSTYFRLLADELEKEGYSVSHINFENYKTEDAKEFQKRLNRKLSEDWNESFSFDSIPALFEQIDTIKGRKFVLIIDEVEGINEEYFGTFLHSIRNAYHSREKHSLKSVILVGVSNITGIISDNASPFNIADELDVPYFTDQETKELLGQHETETGQRFHPKVVQKISEITANQPGLVNGFARRLTEQHPDKEEIGYEDYLRTEEWYLTEAIDKNIANIINKAAKHRKFVEGLLFSETNVPYSIDRPSVKDLHVNGLLRKGRDGNVEFWVPLYRKRLIEAFYPYTNGEGDRIKNTLPLYDIADEATGKIDFDRLISSFKEYIGRRSFRPFREKDEKGNFKSIPEAVMVYSFETYIQSFLQMIGGKSYREAQVYLGNSDLVINVFGKEYLIETKIYRYDRQFQAGKKQLAWYCRKLGLSEGIYLVFVPNVILYPERAKEGIEIIDGVTVKIYMIRYDEEKDF